ncbi:hypothetical protein BH18ACT13_BH18ACT13_16740 [soil metagenome]
MLFQTFPDVLRWQAALEYELGYPSDPANWPMEVRKCVHVGDVLLDGVNPIALAVAQLKLEKQIPDGQVVLTEPAYHAAWPTLGRAYHAFEELAHSSRGISKRDGASATRERNAPRSSRVHEGGNL